MYKLKTENVKLTTLTIAKTIDLILESVFISKENIEILLHKKSQMEQEKFEKLSYKGQKCVEGDTINDELLKKIYNEIKGRGLNLISKFLIIPSFSENNVSQKGLLIECKIGSNSLILYKLFTASGACRSQSF